MGAPSSFDRNFNLGELNSPEFTGNPVPLTPTQRKGLARANIGLTDGQANINVAGIAQITASTTLTAAQALNGVVLANPSAAANITLPTGAQMDANFVPPAYSREFVNQFAATTGQTSTLTICNVNGTNAVTVVAGTNFTISGSASIPLSTSGTFLLIRTAVGTWLAVRE